MNDAYMKVCKQHRGKPLPLDMFYQSKLKNGKPRVDNYCKDCRKLRNIETRSKRMAAKLAPLGIVLLHDPAGLSVHGAEFSVVEFRFDMQYKNYVPGSRFEVRSNDVKLKVVPGIYEVSEDYKLDAIA